MAFGLGKAATADVEYRVNLGEFKADTSEARRIYEQSVQGMSRDTQRLTILSEKLDRAIARFGPASLQARTAGLAYREELSRINAEQNRLEHHARNTSNTLTRSTRGAIAASGAFKGLGNALFFASAGFAGAFGIVYAIRSTIKAASEAQVAQATLEKAVRNAGLGWKENRNQIESTIASMVKLTSFEDEELKSAYAALIVRTGNVDKAFELLNVTTDVARGRHISLSTAVTLVTRASLGQTASLRRLGLDVQKVTTEQDKLRAAGVRVTFQQRQQAKAADEAATKQRVVAALQAKYGGQAAVFSKTAAGAQERFNAVLNDSKEIIGTALLPTITDLLQRGADWLDQQNKSGRLQKEVKRDVHEAAVAVHGLADAFKVMKEVLGPVVQAVGGLHNAVEFLILGTLAFKIGKAVIALKGLGTAFGLVGKKAVIGSAEAVAAENAIGTAAEKNAVKVGLLGRALGGLGGLAGLAGTAAVVTGAVAVADIVAIISAKGGGGARTDHWKRYPNVSTFIWRRDHNIPMTPYERKIINALADKGLSISQLSDAQLKALDTALASVYGTEKGAPTPAHPQGHKPPTTSSRGGAGGSAGPGTPVRTEADIQLDIARAQAQGDEAAQKRFLAELKAYYQRQANQLAARKHLTLLQKQKLTQLYGEIDSTQSQIDALNQADASKAAKAAAARRAAAAKRAREYRAALDTRETRLTNALLRAAATPQLDDDRKALRALIHFYRKEANDHELTAKERARYETKIIKARQLLTKKRAAAELKRLDLKELRLRNAADAAELTASTKDDEKALKRLIAFYKAEEHNHTLSEKARLEARRKEIAARKRLQDDLKKQKGDAKAGQAEFVSAFLSILGKYAPNFFPPAAAATSIGDTRLHELVTETRITNRHLSRIVSTSSYPDTSYVNAQAGAVAA